MAPLLAFLLGLALGSIPFGLLLTRATGAGDLRAIGSGNIGATNVLRTGRKGLAAATLLLDLVKGALPVVFARLLWPDLAAAVAAAAAAGAVIGHSYTPWLRLAGGKGVATLAGAALGLAWPMGAIFAAVWLLTLAVSRLSSLAGILAALSAPLAAWAIGRSAFVPVLVALAVLVLWRHRANLARLRAGTEPRVGAKR